jgi:hypothetical protein
MFGLFGTIIKIQAFENKRFDRLKEKHAGYKKKAKAKTSFAEQYVKETKFINTVIVKQNQIFYLALVLTRNILGVLNDLETDDTDQWKAIQVQVHNFLKLIVFNLDRNDQALILLTLEVISEIVQRFGIPPDLKSTYLSLRLQRFFESLVYLAPYLVFAQLFVRSAFSKAELQLVVPSVLASTNDRYFRDNISHLVSLISANQSVKETLIDKEYYLGIMQLYLTLVEKKVAKGVNRFEKFDLMRALINSLINLANQPEQADKMISNPLFKKLLQFAFDTKDVGLLKLVNNVTAFCSPALTSCMKERVLLIRDLLLDLDLQQHRQQLFEGIAILSNCCLANDWEGFLNKKFLQLMNQLLQGIDGPLRLQTTLLVAQLCRDDKTAGILAKHDTLALVFGTIDAVKDREERFQKLFVAYQLILMNFRMDSYLRDVCGLVEDFLHNEFAERNVRVVSFLNELLFILQVKHADDPEIQSLVVKRSQIYNEEWEARCGITEYADRPQFGGMQGYDEAEMFADGMDYGYDDDDAEYLDDY